MPIILNIETSTTNCSVSLSEDNETICLIEENFEQFSHSKSLHVFIDQILKRSKIVPKDLSAISISEGPGSYTGLRIGVSTCVFHGSTLSKANKSRPSMIDLISVTTTSFLPS